MKLATFARMLVKQANAACTYCGGTGRMVACDEYHRHVHDCTMPCSSCKTRTDNLTEALADYEASLKSDV